MGALVALLGCAAALWRRARRLEGEDGRLRDCWAFSALALLVDGLFSPALQMPASAFLLALGLNAAAGGNPRTEEKSAGLPPRRRIALVLAAALAALWAGTRLVLWQASEVQIGRAMGHIARRDPASAEQSLRKGLEWFPANGRARFFQGNALLLLGEADAAAASFEEAMRRDSDPNIPYDLALARLELGDMTGARRWCAYALRLKPVFPEIFGTLGFISRREGKRQEAEGWLVRSLEAADGNPGVMKELGLLYRQTGRRRDAAALLAEVARIYPQDEETALALRDLRSEKSPGRPAAEGGAR